MNMHFAPIKSRPKGNIVVWLWCGIFSPSVAVKLWVFDLWHFVVCLCSWGLCVNCWPQAAWLWWQMLGLSVDIKPWIGVTCLEWYWMFFCARVSKVPLWWQPHKKKHSDVLKGGRKVLNVTIFLWSWIRLCLQSLWNTLDYIYLNLIYSSKVTERVWLWWKVSYG